MSFKEKSIAKKPRTVKAKKVSKAKLRLNRAVCVIGRRVIMEMGTMTALTDFLNSIERLKFNLLCKHIYHAVMPSISGKFFIDRSGD